MLLGAMITALVALGVALFGLVWLAAARRASRVVLTAAIFQNDGLAWLRVDVDNTGVSPVRVRAIWLWINTLEGRGPVGLLRSEHGRDIAVTDPALPARIENRDWLTWEVDLPEEFARVKQPVISTRAYVALHLSFGVMITAPVEFMPHVGCVVDQRPG